MLLQMTPVGMAIAGMTSIAGRAHTFDSRADGYCRAEGAVAAVFDMHYDPGRGALARVDAGEVDRPGMGYLVWHIGDYERAMREIREETEGVYFSQYSDDQPNILLVGPIPGDQHQEVVFPLLSPDPATDSNIHFGKYQLHVGGNRGRGQVYPTGEKSNNAVYTAPASGSVAAIEDGDNGSSILTINTADGEAVTETIPVGPQLLVNIGDNIEAGAALTNDPNVGGFGQVDAEIVLQNPVRIYGLLAFFAAVALAQIMLVLKKRQIEKVQAAEGNF